MPVRIAGVAGGLYNAMGWRYREEEGDIFPCPITI